MIPELKQSSHAAKAGLITLIILALHCALLVVFKVYFFNYSFDKDAKNTKPPANNSTST